MIGIYKFTNKINNKSYIGQSIHIEQRYKEHLKSKDNTDFHLALQKYGIENFNFSILEECSIKQLNDREKYWISYYDSYNIGYNMTAGGSGFCPEYLYTINKGSYNPAEDLVIGIDEIRMAAKSLTPSALKLYLYFVENKNNQKIVLNAKDFQNKFNVAESTYRKAKQELIKKGYIKEKGNNYFEFYSS